MKKKQFNTDIEKKGEVDDFIPSYIKSVINDFHKKTTAEWEEKLKAYLKENLNQIGYKFENDNHFLDFCKRRVIRLSFQNQPNYYEFFLDFVNEENTGTFIGCCSDKVEFVNEGITLTVILG
jgi:hypothetical protein